MLDISRQIVYKFTISLIASLNDGPEIKVMAGVKTIYHLNKLIEGAFSSKIGNLCQWKVQAVTMSKVSFS